MEKMFLFLLFSIVLFACMPVVFAGELKPDLAEIIEETPADELVSVIVLFHERPLPADVSIIESDGASVKYQYNIIDAVAVTVPAQAVERIAERPFVKLVEPDYDILLVLDEGALQIQADDVWLEGVTGKNIDVAIVDTGIHGEHSALMVEKEIDYTGEGTGDLHGHGTHVAGIIASNDSSYKGIAYEADLFNVKVLGQDGYGYASDVIKGIEWAVENGAEIINLSLGAEISSCDGTDAMSQAVDNAVADGSIAVVAVGNSGPDSGTITSPGCAKEALTVGAVDKSDNIASFSSRGPTADGRIKPDLVAPGVSITSTWNNNSFNSLSGTSMGTPHVSGVTALLLESDSTLSPSEIKEALKSTALDLGLNENTQGAGRVNAFAAFESIKPEELGPTSLSVSISAPESVTEKDSFYVTAVIENTGSSVAEQVVVEIIASEELEVHGEGIKSLGSIEAGLSKETSWIAKAIKSGEASVTVKASAENAELNESTASITVEKEEETDTGTTPDSWLYGFKRFFESADVFFTFDPLGKAKKHVKYAKLRVMEAKEMAEKNRPEFVNNLIKEYEDNMNKFNEITEDAEEAGNNLNSLDELVLLATSKHLTVLEEVYEKVPEQAKKAINKAKTVSMKGYDTALRRASETEPEETAEKSFKFAEERLLKAQEKIEENAENAELLIEEYEKYANKANEIAKKAQEIGKDVSQVSELIAITTSKHLDVLEEVYEKVPEQAKKAINKAKKASVKGNEKALNVLKNAEPEKAAELHFKNAEKKLTKAQEKAEKGETDEAENLIEEYEEDLNKANEIAEIARGLGKNTTTVEQLVAKATSKHLEILSKVYKKVPEQAKEAIENAINASVNGGETALDSLKKKNALDEIPNEIEIPKKVKTMIPSISERRPSEEREQEEEETEREERRAETPSESPAEATPQIETPASSTPQEGATATQKHT